MDKEFKMGNQVIRLLLVHEIRLMCNVLAAAMEGESDILVVGYATTVEEAMEWVAKGEIDIILAIPTDHGVSPHNVSKNPPPGSGAWDY
jgi:hypothetical protein